MVYAVKSSKNSVFCHLNYVSTEMTRYSHFVNRKLFLKKKRETNSLEEMLKLLPARCQAAVTVET